MYHDKSHVHELFLCLGRDFICSGTLVFEDELEREQEAEDDVENEEAAPTPPSHASRLKKILGFEL